MPKYNTKHCFSVGGKFSDAEFTAVEERALEYAGDSALTNEHYAAAANDILAETKTLLKQLTTAVESQYVAPIEQPEPVIEPTSSPDEPVKMAGREVEDQNWTKDDQRRSAKRASALELTAVSRAVKKLNSLQTATDYESALSSDDARQQLSDVRYARLQDDADLQSVYLEEQAKKAGYKDVEDLLEKDYDKFVEIAGKWREDHPETVMYSRADTPAFKQWFGEGSSMVNEDGSPMVLYHGTTKQNERALGVFRRSKIGAMGPAIYLGDSKEASAGYDDGAMMQVYARGKYLNNIQWTDYVSKHGWAGAEKAARADGFSGVYDSQFENAIAVWDSQDIKSATKNNGSFDPTNPDIRYSRSVKPRTLSEVGNLMSTGKISYDLSEAFRRDQFADAFMKAKDPQQRAGVWRRMGDSLINTFADSLIPVKRWIEGSSMSEPLKQRLTGDMYRADTVRSSLEHEAIQKFIDPMHKAIQAAAKATKKTTDEVKQIAGFWMSTRYAPEANQRLIDKDRAELADAVRTGDLNLIGEAQHNLNQRLQDVYGIVGQNAVRGVAGGYNNATAAKYKADAEQLLNPQLLEDIAKHVYAMMDWKKAMDIREGKVTQQMVNGWLNSPHYVPLTGDPRANGDFQDVFNAGNRINQQKEFALNGRTDSIADDGIDASLTAVIKSINHSSFQDFKRSLNQAYEEAQAAGEDIGITREPISGMQRIGDDVVMYRDTVVNKGKESTKGYAFKFADRAVIGALRKTNQESLSSALGVLSRGTSLYGRLVTQFMPMFAPVNFIRDIWERSEIARIKKLLDSNGNQLDMDKLARRMIALSVNPELWKATVGKSFKRGGMTAVRAELEEQLRLGGISTWGDYVSRTGSEFEDKVRKNNNPISQSLDSISDFMGSYSNSFEMVPSLAAYVAAKEMGVNAKDAAAFSLDLMNFRKKGTVMPTVKAFYVFSQPAAQSGYNLAQYLSTRKGQIRFTTQVLLATALYAMMAAGWGDEDDEELGNKLDNMPNFTTDRSIPIKLGEHVFKVPVGFGPPQLAWLLGVTTNRLASGRYEPKDAAFEAVKGIVKTVAPVSPSDIELSKRPVDFLVQTMTPTVIKPLMNIAMDQTGMGGALTPQFKNPDKMRYEQSKRNTPGVFTDVAKELHSITGVDMYPDHIKELTNGVLIGPWHELMKVFVYNPAATSRGDTPSVPVVSQMLDTYKSRAVQASIYYRVRNDLETANKELNRLKTEDPSEITPELREKANAFAQFKSSELMLAHQRTALKKMNGLDDETHDIRLQAIEERADAAQRRVLLRYMSSIK